MARSFRAEANLNFRESCETYKPAYAAFAPIARYFGLTINDLLATSSLASFDIKFRYVPIVMPDGMRERYPARSRMRRKERTYDCAPQLDYQVFVDGAFEKQVREYARGISIETSKIVGLGATSEQVAEFAAIISAVVERALVDRPDAIRH